MGKVRAEPQKFATLANAMVGSSQGPNYAVIEAPGEADQAIGICEYSYFYSKLDLSRRAADRLFGVRRRQDRPARLLHLSVRRAVPADRRARGSRVKPGWA